MFLLLPTPPIEGLPLLGGGDTFVGQLVQRIKSGATAEEITHKIMALILLAGLYTMYGADDVPEDFRVMAEAFDILADLLEIEARPEPSPDVEGFRYVGLDCACPLR